jgi:acetyl-CoA carboxylase carboxyl transferase subunit beta
MNWLTGKITKFVETAKNKILKKRSSSLETSQSLWVSCPDCKEMLLKTDLQEQLNICKCSYHFDLDPKTRFEKTLFDHGEMELIPCPDYANPDPLSFKINGKKFIDKYKGYQKKTGQQSALFIAKGKVDGLNIVAVGYNFAFGGGAMSLRESEHLLTAMQVALDEKVDAFCTFYQSGGMNVTGNLFSLSKGMAGVLVATKMLKDAGIVTIACLSSKTTGGTFVNVYGNDIIFSEKASNLLFAGARVSASVNVGNEIPADFGHSSSLEQHGMIDGEVGRLEFKSKISSLVKVMLKKVEKSNTSSGNVTIDQSILRRTSKAL